MMKNYISLILVITTCLSLFSQTKEAQVTSSLDNTMFKDSDVSNGLGEYIFTGTTNKDVKKRALVQFNLTEAVPEGITVDSVSLILVPSRVKPGSTTVVVHIVTTEWGEGTSIAEDGDGKGAPATTGDATWSFAKYNSVPWIKKGGDFDLESSVSGSVSSGTNAVFRSDRLTQDVNFWLQNPSKNFGWILIGDESKTATSVKFVSKDHKDHTQWPTLTLYYQGATSVAELSTSDPHLSLYQGANLSNIHIQNSGDPLSGQIEIYSIAGSMIYSNNLELSTGNNTVVTNIQEPGIYLYRITADGSLISGKFMIQNR